MTQFLCKFFTTLRLLIAVKKLNTAGRLPQTNGQVERYNRIQDAMLRHYKSEHKWDLDTYVPPLTYAYNPKAHYNRRYSPVNIMCPRGSTSPATLGCLPGSVLNMPPDARSRNTNKRVLGCVQLMKEARGRCMERHV